MDDVYRITRRPPYLLAAVTDLKVKPRARGKDIIDLGMGHPDRATPRHIVDKLVEAAANEHRIRRAVCGIRTVVA